MIFRYDHDAMESCVKFDVDSIEIGNSFHAEKRMLKMIIQTIHKTSECALLEQVTEEQ